MIVGGREAAKVVDRLKAAKVPVVLRLNLPEEPQVPTEQEYRKKAAAERDEPLRVLAHRKTKWKEQLATAAVLAKAGIPFAFATDGVDRLETFPANLRQVIAAGLNADDALAALTKNAAAIAGVDRRLGTLEPGKLGHVIAMTAPFSDEKAKVKFVLVDGLKFEIKPEDSDRAKAKGRRSWLAPAVGQRGREDRTAEETKAPAEPGRKAPACRAPGTQRPASQPFRSPAGTAPGRHQGTTRSRFVEEARPGPRRERGVPDAEGSEAPRNRRTRTEEREAGCDPSPRPRSRLRPRPRRRRSSTWPPSSTKTASRRSTPAATS